MKRILFVGSMYDQKLRVLEEAKAMELYVTLIGNDYPTWGSRFIDLYIKSDNYNPEKTIQVLDELGLKFDGVVTFWDRDVELTAKIAQHFNLPGCPIKAATIMRNKYLTRETLTKHRIPNIDYRLVTDLSNLAVAAEQIGFPVIIKPISASSSKGIFKINNKEDIPIVKEEIAKTINPQKDKMFTYNLGKFIVEQFLVG